MRHDQRAGTDPLLDEQVLTAAVTALPYVQITDDMRAVLKIFEANPDLTIIPILNSREQPIGAIAERDFKRFMYMPFGPDLLRNRSCPVTLLSLSRPCPVLELGVELGSFIESVADDVQDGVMVTREGRYVGFLAANTLLKISNRHRLAQAEDRNPLSKLPGNRSIERFVDQALAAKASTRIFCIFDFDNFKPFNDNYGFRVGDRAIQLFADLMRSRLGERHWFLGHVGGDDFFAGTTALGVERAEAQIASLVHKFAYDAESFYDPQHRAEGFIMGQHRDGRPAKFGLLRCSAAILTVGAQTRASTSEDFGRRIAALKKASKAAPGGIFMERLDAHGESNLAA